MQIKEIIQQTGLNRETLRFYESKGLLPEARRTEAGYRLFPPAILPRIHFILQAQRAGFTLAEIKELIDFKKNGVSCREGREFAMRKKNEIAEKLKSLKVMEKLLSEFVRKCENRGEKGLTRPCHFSFDQVKDKSGK